LVNTDGMSFIGPGSEWFWTALSGIVLAVTFVAIYRQLRLQRSAAAVEQLNGIMHEWSSERLARAKFAILVALQAGTDPTDLPDRAVATVGFFWQQVGYLVRGGHVDRQLVYGNLGGQVQVWWALLFPGAPRTPRPGGRTSRGSPASRQIWMRNAGSIATSTPKA
jgi:hypothetical protein